MRVGHASSLQVFSDCELELRQHKLLLERERGLLALQLAPEQDVAQSALLIVAKGCARACRGIHGGVEDLLRCLCL
eukprot:CAMPEP_0174713134 /NCGR_PEP_ID=MMETSP1094-20130205/13913_1 /TAXON_ID=156173 /ORGANISM="Chrysochromulina brevifilum, Strain UTEX LB 985" /LENGTH=75 /DNA_ID=CAMNT_0015912291 /DNA_START=41 /DNA_END=268 /DNA_ORIENTATION=+